MKYLLVILVVSTCSCVVQPVNLEGKSFDANSGYCKELLSRSTSMVHYDPRNTNATTSLDRSALVSQIERDSSARIHDLDCESRSAYNLRTKDS